MPCSLFLVQTPLYSPANYRGEAGDFSAGPYKCGLVLVPEERSCPAAPCARPSMVALLSCFCCFNCLNCLYGILFATAYCVSRIFIPSISASSAWRFGCIFHRIGSVRERQDRAKRAAPQHEFHSGRAYGFRQDDVVEWP